MGNAKKKGSRVELEIVKALNEIEGVYARKMPLSGAIKGLSGDIAIFKSKKAADNFDQAEMIARLEVKARKNGEGFALLEKWLGENDVLVLKQNYREPFVFMTLANYLELLASH